MVVGLFTYPLANPTGVDTLIVTGSIREVGDTWIYINTYIMLSQIARILVVVGGINWGLVGLGMLMGSDWNVVHMILGSWMTLEALVYILVGLSAIWMVVPRR